MSAVASQITSIMIVYATVCSGTDQRKHQSSASLAFVQGIHREYPTQRASNAENVSIWWHHHDPAENRSYNQENDQYIYLKSTTIPGKPFCDLHYLHCLPEIRYNILINASQGLSD